MKSANLVNSKYENTKFIKRAVVLTIFYAILLTISPTANLRQVSAQTTAKPMGNSIDKGDFKLGYRK